MFLINSEEFLLKKSIWTVDIFLKSLPEISLFIFNIKLLFPGEKN